MDFLIEGHNCFYFLVLDVVIASLLVVAAILRFRDLNMRMEKILTLSSAGTRNSKQSSMQVSELKSYIQFNHEEIKDITTKIKNRDSLIKLLLQALEKNLAETNDISQRVAISVKQNNLEDDQAMSELAASMNCRWNKFNQKMEQVCLTANRVFEPKSKEGSADDHKGEITDISAKKFDQVDADNLIQSIRAVVKECLEEFHRKDAETREKFSTEMKNMLNSVKDAGKAGITEAFKNFSKFQSQENDNLEKDLNYMVNFVDYLTHRVLSATNDLKCCLGYLYVNQTNLDRENRKNFDEKLNQLQNELTEALKKVHLVQIAEKSRVSEDQMLDDIEIDLVPNF